MISDHNAGVTPELATGPAAPVTLTRDALIHLLDQWLEPAAFQDYAPNGLQVTGKPEIRKLVTGVTASLALIETAIAAGADAIAVHHGYFWRGESPALTGMKGNRIRKLLNHDLSLIAYHLPLDAHPQWGNNAILAQEMGWTVTGPLDPAERYPIGNIGTCTPQTPEQLARQLEQVLQRPPLVLAGGPALIQRIGWCTGGAQDYIDKAAALGCDAFVSGEASERTCHAARELGIHYFGAGHHATERGGIRALGEQVAAATGLCVEFIDIDNSV